MAAGLLQQTQALRVDLHTPEVTINLEVKGDAVFIIERLISGIGGYPQGSQEAVVSLISGGFDSIVASYLTMKRGCKNSFFVFQSRWCSS